MFRRKCEVLPPQIERGQVDAILWGLADIYSTVLAIRGLLEEEDDGESEEEA